MPERARVRPWRGSARRHSRPTALRSRRSAPSRCRCSRRFRRGRRRGSGPPADREAHDRAGGVEGRAAVEPDAGAGQVESDSPGPAGCRRWPPASGARRCRRVIWRKARSWAAFIACWSGSSAQARWLITRTGARARTPSRSAAQSAGSSPSRFMPVSSWMPKGAGAAPSKWRVSCSMEFSSGISVAIADHVGVARHVARRRR